MGAKIVALLRKHQHYLIGFVVVMLCLVGYTWYHNGGHNPARVVQGRIFRLTVEDHGEMKDYGYLVFGGEKEDYGSLLIFNGNKQASIDDLNASGQLSKVLKQQSSQRDRFWDTTSDHKNLTWGNGLLMTYNGSASEFTSATLHVNKISGIYHKKISGEFDSTNGADIAGTENCVLTEYAVLND